MPQLETEQDKKNPVRDKSFAFAVKIVQLYKNLIQKHEYVLSKQCLRSGTSIGANVEEAMQAQSKKDFASKMNIALKEAYETRYWLKLLYAGNYIVAQTYSSLVADVEELIRLLVAIVKTATTA